MDHSSSCSVTAWRQATAASRRRKTRDSSISRARASGSFAAARMSLGSVRMVCLLSEKWGHFLHHSINERIFQPERAACRLSEKGNALPGVLRAGAVIKQIRKRRGKLPIFLLKKEGKPCMIGKNTRLKFR